jgi:hypothetical protein
MVERPVLKDVFTREMAEAGLELTRRLVERFPVTASFWFYVTDLNSYRLFIATPIVTEKGPRAVYGEIERVLRELPEASRAALELRDITAIEDTAPLVTAISRAASTTETTTGVDFRNIGAGADFIEHLHAYRLPGRDTGSNTVQPSMA